MMDQDGICVLLHRGIKQGLRRRHSGNNMANRVSALHLKPVGAVVFEALGVQRTFKPVGKLPRGNLVHLFFPQSLCIVYGWSSPRPLPYAWVFYSSSPPCDRTGCTTV